MSVSERRVNTCVNTSEEHSGFVEIYQTAPTHERNTLRTRRLRERFFEECGLELQFCVLRPLLPLLAEAHPALQHAQVVAPALLRLLHLLLVFLFIQLDPSICYSLFMFFIIILLRHLGFAENNNIR